MVEQEEMIAATPVDLGTIFINKCQKDTLEVLLRPLHAHHAVHMRKHINEATKNIQVLATEHKTFKELCPSSTVSNS